MLNIPDKPFSARTSTDWTKTLEDGSTVTTHLDAMLARDSVGRVYRENHTFVPANSGEKSPLYEIHIYDPRSRYQIICSTHSMKCVVTDYLPHTFFETQQAGPYDNGTKTLARESLGSDSIEGLSVSGTRETVTVNQGVKGNERPLVSVNEFWYSNELQTNLLVSRTDPIEGKQVIRLSNLSLGQPDAHLFEVPLGYTVQDMRSSVLRHR
ncbi:hypothetical protein [Terracidiphilus gabretensis]|uniref:hypothetical protein n=1 Tax=Terracidiphilus gabretensis TaxID=1577687 RepID=UPI00071B259A|nr:hypothetical protein [Terracidiphilus gabretensis]